jgi:hypothetical protein
MTDWRLRRRDVLRRLGAGAACLPVLHATRSYGAEPAFPRRLIIVVATNGYPTGEFLPAGVGDALSGLTFSKTLSPLDPWKEELVIFPQLRCPNIEKGEDFHRSYPLMLTGAPAADETPRGASTMWPVSAPTLDQVIANALSARESRPLRTLPLHVQVDRSSGGAPFSKLEARRAFWSGPNQPITPEGNPYKVMDMLLSGSRPADPALDRIRAENRSMLDFLGRDLERFAERVGTEDRRSIQGHLQAIRDVEAQMRAPAPTAAACRAPAPPAGQPLAPDAKENYAQILSLQMDLMVTALRCDVTRVATLQIASAWGHAVSSPWLGTGSAGWHDIAHQNAGPKRTIDQWMMGQFAELLGRLKAVREGAGSMLDNTVVLWANTMWDGNHGPYLPWILAGKCGGYFKTGQFLRSAHRVAVNRVMVDICNAMGVPRTTFAVEALGGALPGLRAGT